MDVKKIPIDKGTFQEAQKEELTVAQLLEKLDPSSQYTEPELKSMTALERQFMARNLALQGGNAVNLEAFYSAAGPVLFIEFIESAIREGAAVGGNVALDEDLCYMLSEIPGKTFQEAKADFESTDQDLEMKRTAEGANFSVCNLALAETNVSMAKYARLVKFTEEYRRRARVDQVKTALNFIGLKMALEYSHLAISVLVNGNSGESNPAPNTNTAGTLAYSHLVAFQLAFNPYSSNLWVAPAAMLTKLLNMSEFKNPLSGMKFQESGAFISPFGNGLKQSAASALSTTKILGIDTRFGIRRVREQGSYMIETDYILNGQWHRIGISEYRGYAKDFANSARTLTETGE